MSKTAQALLTLCLKLVGWDFSTVFCFNSLDYNTVFTYSVFHQKFPVLSKRLSPSINFLSVYHRMLPPVHILLMVVTKDSTKRMESNKMNNTRYVSK